MNIFQKTCPQCATPNSPDAVSCRCGFCFDPELLAETDPDAYARQQERLYREYVLARLVRANGELSVVRAKAMADPQDAQKAAALRAAEKAVSTLRAELEGGPAQTRASGAPEKAAPADAARRGLSRPAAAPRAATRSAARMDGTPTPGERFRRMQATKAQAAVAPAGQPTAKPAAANARTGQECPHCTARVAAGVERCRCGYTFSQASKELPPLSLDPGALAILTDGPFLTRKPPRR